VVEQYLHSPIRLHGVVLNYLSTGTTLPQPFENNNNVKLNGNPTFQLEFCNCFNYMCVSAPPPPHMGQVGSDSFDVLRQWK
jgi:hypothetical protein